ncbi:hypothetical protein QEZ54_23255 [Catellatospora sp. KI3]|uniref:hypothetical protein n=1 Tax=Catellatospora sp. KI3 TaxID=3041620 RepID=UPI0024830FCC|nr:hypothetical protein [Catellatospora sp. KI3]MDI1463908.1 hypothetical protein [Catellatospora sp. KI3]
MTTASRPHHRILSAARAGLLSLGLAATLAATAPGAPGGRLTEAGFATASAVTLTSTAAHTTIGGTIHDHAELSGAVDPTGTITFHLYIRFDTECSVEIFSSTVAVDGNGPYDSAPYTPTEIGDYPWIAEYSGDANNPPVSTPCSDYAEISGVSPAQPKLQTNASPDVVLGNPIHDTAMVTDGHAPIGGVEFYLFGPDDANCTGPVVFRSYKSLDGDGSYDSAEFTPTRPGTYRWVAGILGDEENDSVSGHCNQPNEEVTVTVRGLSLATQASPNVAVGGRISDAATLTGGDQPTGTMTFRLYGPNDSDCAKAPAFTGTAVVDGNGVYSSGEFAPTKAGTYRWIAAYSGDTDNEPVAGACNDTGERVIVSPRTAPKLVTDASANTLVGRVVRDVATLSGGSSPTGTIKFTLYGPNDPTCAKVAFTRTVTISGNGTYRSGDFRPGKAGTYRWRAEYSGDSRNGSVLTACDDAAERVIVRPLS